MIKDLIINFRKAWLEERDLARKQISENRSFNVTLKKSLERDGRLNEYKSLKRTYELGGLKASKYLENDLVNFIDRRVNVGDERRYLVKGSIGSGIPSDVPWLCVFDRGITTSAQNGYYVVYLFSEDSSGVYLSLAQAWTQYEKVYGIKDAKTKISKNVKLAQESFRTSEGFSKSKIDLKSTRTLAKGYELGTMLSRYYDLENLPENSVLENDLFGFLGAYKEIKAIAGKDIVNLVGGLSEDEFQLEIQEASVSKLPKGRIEVDARGSTSTTTRWKRKASISHEAIVNADYRCEVDKGHKTFISARTENQFVEAHHLIPMEYQGDFEFSIDVPENIVSLCPNCHRKFHNAKREEKKGIIQKIFEERQIKLKAERGITISLDKLFSYYD